MDHGCPVPVGSEGSHGQKAVVLSHSEHPAMVHVRTEGGNISKAAIQDNAVSKQGLPWASCEIHFSFIAWDAVAAARCTAVQRTYTTSA